MDFNLSDQKLIWIESKPQNLRLLNKNSFFSLPSLKLRATSALSDMLRNYSTTKFIDADEMSENEIVGEILTYVRLER